jgi:hypothetical protein
MGVVKTGDDPNRSGGNDLYVVLPQSEVDECLDNDGTGTLNATLDSGNFVQLPGFYRMLVVGSFGFAIDTVTKLGNQFTIVVNGQLQLGSSAFFP